MAAITSNGTGGGNASTGSSWTGGVAPTEGDTCQIRSGDTITIDANWTVGADSATPAIDILSGGTLNWDGLGAADVVICKGDFYVRNGGTLTLSGTADITKTLTIKLNYSASLAVNKYGMIMEDGSVVSIQGFNKVRNWDTISVDCANGQKVLVTTNDNSTTWQIGDNICALSISQNSSAGAEEDPIANIVGTSITATNNWTYTHEQNCAVVNTTNNITITAYNASYNAYVVTYNTTAGNLNLDWVTFSELGANTALKYGFTFGTASTIMGTIDNCVFYNNYYGIYMNSYTGYGTFSNICVIKPGSHAVYATCCTFQNSVFGGGTLYTNLNGFDMTYDGVHVGNIGSIYNVSRYVRFSGTCRFYGGRSDEIAYASAIELAGGTKMTSTASVYIDKCRHGIRMTQGASGEMTGNVYIGSVTANTTDDVSMDGVGTNLVMTNGNTLSLTVVDASSWDNGKVSVRTTANAHKTWTPYGTYTKQNTTKRTSSTNAAQFSPTDATTEIYNPIARIPATASRIVSYSCWIRKDAAMATLPYIQLTGCGVTASTATMTNSTDTWEMLTVYGEPTESGFCDIYVGIKNASGNVYLDDDFDSYNLWYKGDLPVTVPKPSLTANDVWNVDLSAFTTGNVAGNKLRQNNSNIKSML